MDRRRVLGFPLLSTGFVGYVIVCIQLASLGNSLTTDIMSMASDSPVVCSLRERREGRESERDREREMAHLPGSHMY